MAINTYDNRRLLGAFRENLNAALTPVIQCKYPYLISDRFLKKTLTGTGAITQENSMAKVSTGATSSSSAHLASHDEIVYQAGQGALIRFTSVFSQGIEGSTQLIGIGDNTDGYFIGFNGADFGVLRRQNGTDYWVPTPQVGDGSDNVLGNTDVTKGNVYQIQYQWLGFGQITYSMYDFIGERYVTIYRENYPNNHTVPSTFNPSFPMYMKVENTTNATNIDMFSASFGAFIEGRATQLTTTYSTESSKTITAETSVLDIRVKETFQGKNTRAVIFPKFLSVASDGTKTVKVRLYEDAALGGVPSYTSVHTESAVEYDTAGTTVTGGYPLMSFNVSKVGNILINLDKIVRLHNLDNFTVTAESSNASEVDIGLTWEELI